jgi:hypothetical protein
VKDKPKTKIWLVPAILSCVFFSSCGISERKPSNFPFVDTTADGILGLKDVRAILFVDYNNIDMAETKMLIGDPNEFEKITYKNYKFIKVVNDDKWVGRILNEYKEAIREAHWQGSGSDARVIFITKKKGYMLRFDYDDKVVYNEHLSSEKLWRDLDEIGFIEHEKPCTLMPPKYKTPEK